MTATLDRPAPSILRARAPLIVGVMLLVVALSFLLGGHQKRSYSSSTDVLVEPIVFATGNVGSTPEMGAEKAIATSDSVAMIAAQQLSLPATEVQRGLSVTVPVDTDTLHITQTAASPTEAQRRAFAVADAYVKFRNDSLPRAGLPGPSGNGALQSHVTRAGAERAAVISAASLPDQPASSKRAFTLVIAAVVGLALGLGTAVTIDRMDDRLRSGGDLEAQVGLPLLAEVAGPGPVAETALWDSAVQPIDGGVRHLWARLRLLPLLSTPDGGGKVVAITSSVTSAAVGAVATRLAVLCAGSGVRVLLIRGTLEGWPAAGYGPQDGLYDVLAGHADAELIVRTIRPGLEYMPLGDGADVALPAPGTSSDGWARLLSQRDLILVVPDAVPDSASGLVLAATADGVVLAEDRRLASRSSARRAASELATADCLLVGGVFVRSARRGRWRRGSQPPATARGTEVNQLTDSELWLREVRESSTVGVAGEPRA